MEIIGRVTANAKVTETKSEKKVVNFSIAVNDRYKQKGSSEFTEVTTFYQCSYWINPAIAQYLTKGTLVELAGRIGVNAYKNMQGEAVGRLTFHVDKIKLHGKSKGQKETVQAGADEIAVPADDLPF